MQDLSSSGFEFHQGLRADSPYTKSEQTKMKNDFTLQMHGNIVNTVNVPEALMGVPNRCV